VIGKQAALAAGRDRPAVRKKWFVWSRSHPAAGKNRNVASMDERRTARIVGLSLGAIFATVLVLNALAGF